MHKQTIPSVFSQAPEEFRQIFQEEIRQIAYQALLHVLEEERSMLCGPSHRPLENSPYVRAGSSQATVTIQGKRKSLSRPRVRQVDSQTGQSSEVELLSWRALKDDDSTREAVQRAVLAGVSSRGVKTLTPEEARGLSKSQVSRLWQEKASELAQELQKSDLSGLKLFGIMIDGVYLTRDQVVTVALGLVEDGTKKFLGYMVGSSENSQVCMDLLNNLEERGLKIPKDRYWLAFVDDSDALKKALKEKYGEVLMIQGCLVHLQRNLRGYVARKHYEELAKIMKALRESQGEEKCREHWKRLVEFVKSQNHQAGERLEAQEAEMTSLIKLGAPNTINQSLLSTNCIENSFANLRRLIGRVTRWREGCEMAHYWTGSGLWLAEQGFRKIRGYNHLPELFEKLREKYSADKKSREEGIRP